MSGASRECRSEVQGGGGWARPTSCGDCTYTRHVRRPDVDASLSGSHAPLHQGNAMSKRRGAIQLELKLEQDSLPPIPTDLKAGRQQQIVQGLATAKTSCAGSLHLQVSTTSHHTIMRATATGLGSVATTSAILNRNSGPKYGDLEKSRFVSDPQADHAYWSKT